MDTLVGRSSPPLSSAISVEEFSSYFNEKMASFRRSIEGSPDTVYQTVPPGCSFLDQFAASHDTIIFLIVSPSTDSVHGKNVRF